MSDARTVLAEWQQRTDAATEGPWAWTFARPDEWGHQGPDLEAPSGDVLSSWGHDADGLMLKAEDAEFIVAAREAMPKLLAAVEAVLALHTTTMRKVRVYEPGRVSFGDLVERPFCSHCKHAGDAPHPWPCPTVQAINDALLASEPSGSEQ